MSQWDNGLSPNQGRAILATQEPITDTQVGDPYPSYSFRSGGSTGGSVLETAVQEFATALERSRMGLWDAAWFLHDLFGPTSLERSKEDRKALRKTIGALAQVGNCTGAWITQLWAVGEAFPEEGSLHQDRSLAWHRKVAQRAKALKRNVAELAKLADEKGWGQFDLDQLEKPPATRSLLEAACKECGAVVKVKAEGLKGLMVPCPVCVGIKYEGVPDRPYEGFLGRLG